MKWNDEEQVQNIAAISVAAQTELKIVLHTWLERQREANGQPLQVCSLSACTLQDKW